MLGECDSDKEGGGIKIQSFANVIFTLLLSRLLRVVALNSFEGGDEKEDPSHNCKLGFNLLRLFRRANLHFPFERRTPTVGNLLPQYLGFSKTYLTKFVGRNSPESRVP